MFVYLITNTIDGKRYIGQTTTSLEERWRVHKIAKNCRYLHAAIEKHGEENFTIEAICEPPTIELMNEFEAEYIRRYNTLAPNGYNLTEGGRVPRHHEDTRKKMSLSHKGFRPPSSFKENWTPEMREAARQRWSGINNPGAKLTPGQAKKIRNLYAAGEYSQTEIAKMFSISQPRVSEIVTNRIRIR
jgi:group I intron endonuclease